MNLERKTGLFCLAMILILFSCFIYQGTIRNHILEWDDQVYVRDNPHIKALNISNIKSILSMPYFKNYTPVHLLSYLFDHVLWGDNYNGYHLTNLLIHILNGVLILILMQMWFNDRFASFFVFALFLIHPIHVESVAWISERKGLLAGFFFLAALLSYHLLRKTGRRGWYILCFILFCMAILSKPVAITLPLILILFDLALYRKRISLTDLLPFFLISLFSFATTVWAQKVGGGIKGYLGGSLLTSISATPYIILRYLARLIWPFPPFRLSCRYVIRPERFLPRSSILPLGSLILLLSILFAIYAWFVDRKERTVFLGVMWFFIILLPVLNFIPTSTQMADRYLYLPAIGIYWIVGIWVSKWIKKIYSSRGLFMAFIIIVIFLVAFGLQTRRRVRIWRSDETLWKDALEEEPENYYALTYLGNYYLQGALGDPEGEESRVKLEEAEDLFLHALDIAPDFAQANLGLASIMIQTERIQEAFPLLQRALKTNTEPLQRVRIHYDLGLAFMHNGQEKEAEYWFKKVINEDKGFKSAYLGLGQLYMNIAENEGDKGLGYQKAACVFQEMLRIFPDDFRAYFSLAVLKGKQGRIDEAIHLYQRAISLAMPVNRQREKADAHINLGILYQTKQKYWEALFHYESALKIAPNHPMALQIKKVISELRAALSPRI